MRFLCHIRHLLLSTEYSAFNVQFQMTPGLYCGLCEANVVNYTVNNVLANCLTLPRIEELISVDRFEKRLVEGAEIQKHPPCVKHKPLQSISTKSRKVNATHAAKVIESWKRSGISDHVRYYVTWNLPSLTSFLVSHHGLPFTAAISEPIPEPGFFDENFESPRACESREIPASDDSSEHGSFTSRHSCDPVTAEASDSATLDDSSEDWSSDDDDGSQNVKLGSCDDRSNGDDDDNGGDGFVKTRGRKKRATHRDIFEMIKAVYFLSDGLMTKILRLWAKYRPVEDWNNFPTDGRLLSNRSARHYMRKFKPRRVVCGLKTSDGVPFHKKDIRDDMLRRFDETGTTIDAATAALKPKGDCIDFDVEECLLLETPGVLEPEKLVRLLRLVHAANPDLLSPHFLRIVDMERFHDERLRPNPKRSRMNYFALKWHADGVQIAKNSRAPGCVPISFAIERVCPYNPETMEVDTSQVLVIPASASPVLATTVYHGIGKSDLFQMTQFWHSEEYRLHPRRVMPPGEQRRIVVESRLRCGDTPIKALLTGM